MTDTPSPIEAYKLAMQCYGVPNERLQVYDSNSYRRVGLEREYKVLVYADRMDDGQLNIAGQSILRAMVAAFNAMPDALKEIEYLREAAGFPPDGAKWDPGIRAVLAAQAADQRDAERYRWLRHGDNDEKVVCNDGMGTIFLLRNDQLDAEIDKALASAHLASVYVDDRQFVPLNPAIRAECEAIMAEGAKVLAQHPEMVHATAEPPTADRIEWRAELEAGMGFSFTMGGQYGPLLHGKTFVLHPIDKEGIEALRAYRASLAKPACERCEGTKVDPNPVYRDFGNGPEAQPQPCSACAADETSGDQS